ncbi:MAG: RcnB family protein [Rhizomicrobium sp.]
MKHIVLPALSLVLLAAMPAQARIPAHSLLQIAQNDPDRARRGGLRPSPAVAPAAPVDHAPAPPARARTGGHPAGAAPTIDRTAGGLLIGGQGNRPAAHTPAPRTPAARTPAARTPAARTPAARTPAARTPAARTPAARTPATRTPAGRTPGGGAHGATNGGGHGGATVFGTRPSNWNQYPRTFNRGTYQRNLTAPRQFHWQTYNRPSGWYYRRWVFGQVFPTIFRAQNYWLTDYWMFNLPVPPYGYVWVRYDDDAVLIDKQTGVVLQVVYGLFD